MIGIPDFWSTRWLERPIFSRACPFVLLFLFVWFGEKTNADLKSRRSEKYAPREAPSRSTPFVVLSFVRYFLSIRHLRGQILLY